MWAVPAPWKAMQESHRDGTRDTVLAEEGTAPSLRLLLRVLSIRRGHPAPGCGLSKVLTSRPSLWVQLQGSSFT